MKKKMILIFACAYFLCGSSRMEALAETTMYWTSVYSNKISCANLDGTGVTDLITDIEPESLALDLANNKMYFGKWSNGSKIQSANLDGTGITDLVDDCASSIALTPEPATLLLFGFGGLLLRRKRFNQ